MLHGREDIPLQPMERTTLEQKPTLQPGEDHTLEQIDMPLLEQRKSMRRKEIQKEISTY